MGGLEKRKLEKGRRQPKRAMDAIKAKEDSKKKWDRKMRLKARDQNIRQLSQRLKDDINAENKKVAESRKANAQRKLENEKKNLVVQTIKNDKAIKKLSPKHRRKARIYMLHELN